MAASPPPAGLSLGRWHPSPLVAGGLVGLAVFTAACLSGTALYVRATAALREEVRHNLIRAAAAGAALVDPDQHRRFTDPRQESSPAYQAALEPLRRVQRSSADIKYIYTYVLTGDTVRFVLDAAPSGDADGDGIDDKAHIMEVYPDWTPAMVDAIRLGKAGAEETIVADKWGRYLSAYAPFFDQAGRPVGAVGVDIDVSAYTARLAGVRSAAWTGLGIALLVSFAIGGLLALAARTTAQAHCQREAAVTELTRRNAELAEAMSRAEEATRTKSAFLATMSHEIRTPMNGVLGMLGLIVDAGLSGKPQQWAATAFNSAKALLAILNDLLDLSKIEAGKLSLEYLDFDLRTMVEETAALLGGRARAKALDLVCLVHPAVPDFLRGDPGRLRQILLNLGSNAIKFTSSGEVVIRVSLEAATGEHVTVRFEVADTGIGIPADAQDKLFQPFTQVDASTARRFGGTGLGLSICRQLAELMDGTIGLQSVEGQGSTFWFTARLQHATSPAPELPAHPDLAGVRILLVEEHAASRAMFAQAAAQAGMTSAEAQDAAHALVLLREATARGEPFDVALLELRLPDTDGFALARQIRNDPALHRTKTILVTALGEQGHAQAARDAGGAAYLTKPVRAADLYHCIAAVVRPAGEATTPAPLITQHTLATAKARRRLRLLLVEDHEVNQALAVELLEREGYRVDVAGNGLDALHAVAQTRYALILMDCQMPGMDGFETTAAIRRDEPAGQHVPIVAMTANAMAGDRERCLAAGMDDYVSKPIDPSLLSRTIRRYLPADPDANRGLADDRSASTPPAAAQPLAAAQPVNLGQLQMLVGNDAAKTRKYLRLFVEAAGPTLQALQTALEARDAAQLRRQAHKLKGSSGNIGAETMAGLAAQLESLSPADDWAHAEALRAQLWQSYTETREFANTI